LTWGQREARRAPGVRQRESEEVPVAAGLLTQGRLRGFPCDRLAPVSARCGPGKDLHAESASRSQSSRPPARVEASALPQWWSRGRGVGEGRPRGVSARAGGLHHLGADHGRGGQTHHALAHWHATPPASQTGTDSAMLRFSKRAGAGGPKLPSAGQGAHGANGSPWRGQPGGRSAGRKRSGCRRQRMRGWGLALICRQQQRSAGSSSAIGTCCSRDPAGVDGLGDWPSHDAPPLAAIACSWRIVPLGFASSACCLPAHIGQGKEAGLAITVLMRPASPQLTGRLPWSMLWHVSCLGAIAWPHRRGSRIATSSGERGCWQAICAGGARAASSR